MALFTALEILIWLVLAGAIGGGIGWLLGRVVDARSQESSKSEGRELELVKLSSTVQRLEEVNTRLAREIDSHRADNERLKKRLEEAQADVKATYFQLIEAQDELNKARAAHEAEIQRLGSSPDMSSSEVPSEGSAAATVEQTAPAAQLAVAVGDTGNEETEGDATAERDGAVRLRLARIAERAAGGQPPRRDDLKKLYGIGRTIEKLFNRIGITSYRQVASLTEEDLVHVAVALDVPPERIVGDDWVGSARAEHLKKYGEELAPAMTHEEAEEEVHTIATRTAGGAEVPTDDLQKIYGIGQKIEELLKGMGITSYLQLARFTDSDVEVVGSALETFPDRIVRDDWVGSARRLHIEHHGFDPLE